MPNGFGRGMGRGSGGGMGFGFRGSSPPWPYVGRGRGGLPRCGYFPSGTAGTPAPWPYPASAGYGTGQGAYPQNTAASFVFGNAPFGSPVSPEQELDSLRNQAEAIGEQLEQIGARMHDLEGEKKKTTK